MPKVVHPPVYLAAVVSINDIPVDSSTVHNRTMIADLMWATLADVWPQVLDGAKLTLTVQRDDEPGA